MGETSVDKERSRCFHCDLHLINKYRQLKVFRWEALGIIQSAFSDANNPVIFQLLSDGVKQISWPSGWSRVRVNSNGCVNVFHLMLVKKI